MPELSASIHVEGLETLDRLLGELPAVVRERLLKESLTAGGQVIRQAAAQNIHRRTGQTAEGLTVEVQVNESEVAGAAAIGGSGKRAFVLRFLEFGTKAHDEPSKRGRLRRFEARAGQTLASINAKKRLAFGGHVFSRVHHPGIAPQAPLTSALADQSERTIKVVTDRLWDGILATVAKSGGG
jgi:HK97 gp10 family phage protein